MKISLLISTYERPEALTAVLRSVSRQTRVPDEIVVGDDGSGPDTARVIQTARESGLTIRHAWREHNGFRLARSRNACVAASSCEYLIIIDDDMLLHPEFIRDHEQFAEPGFFVQGGRVLLDAQPARLALETEAYWPSLWDKGVHNKKNLLRCGWLARLFGRPVAGLHGIRTCNFALWRSDYKRVNGFNEDFVGWGREDSEFAARLLHAGVRRRNLRFAAVACHLWHPARSREFVGNNDAILAATVQNKLVRCERGLNLHLDGE